MFLLTSHCKLEGASAFSSLPCVEHVNTCTDPACGHADDLLLVNALLCTTLHTCSTHLRSPGLRTPVVLPLAVLATGVPAGAKRSMGIPTVRYSMDCTNRQTTCRKLVHRSQPNAQPTHPRPTLPNHDFTSWRARQDAFKHPSQCAEQRVYLH